MSVEYVLARQNLKAPERISYFMVWTGIGPAETTEFKEAARFESEDAAMASPASRFALTPYKILPVVGDIVGRPVEWLDNDMGAARQVLIGEAPSDGVQVFE